MSADDDPVLVLASDPRGELIVTGEGPRVLAWTEASAEPIWTYRFAASVDAHEPSDVFRRPAARGEPRVVGLRWTTAGVLALDERGRLVSLARAGEPRSLVHCEVEAFALLVGGGLWAVLHRRGVIIGAGARELRRLELEDLRCGTFADEGNFLALGTGDGRMLVTPTVPGPARELELGAAPRAIAWVGRYGWLVAGADAIVRIDPSYASRETIWTSDRELAGLVRASERICGFRCGAHELVIFDQLRRAPIATVDLAPLAVGELELRAWPRVAVAIEGGGHLRLDLAAEPNEPRASVWRGPRAGGRQLALVRHAWPQIVADEAALERERERVLGPRRGRQRRWGYVVVAIVVIFALIGAC